MTALNCRPAAAAASVPCPNLGAPVPCARGSKSPRPVRPSVRPHLAPLRARWRGTAAARCAHTCTAPGLPERSTTHSRSLGRAESACGGEGGGDRGGPLRLAGRAGAASPHGAGGRERGSGGQSLAAAPRAPAPAAEPAASRGAGGVAPRPRRGGAAEQSRALGAERRPPARPHPRPGRLRARRTWRRRWGGTLYLSTGPTASAGTGASSSSSKGAPRGGARGAARPRSRRRQRGRAAPRPH